MTKVYQDLQNVRLKKAEACFAAYDMGELQVKDTGAWQLDCNLWSRSVYLENGDLPSIKVTFEIMFGALSDEIVNV